MAVADHNDQNGDPEVKQRSCCLLGHGGNRFARLLDELGGQASQDQTRFSVQARSLSFPLPFFGLARFEAQTLSVS